VSIPDAYAAIGVLPILAGLWEHEGRWWLIGVGVLLVIGALAL
jgi:hypothetical protein